MYLRSFICEEAKMKKRTSSKKQLCEIGEEAIWEFRFTSFLSTNYNGNDGNSQKGKYEKTHFRDLEFRFTLLDVIFNFI